MFRLTLTLLALILAPAPPAQAASCAAPPAALAGEMLAAVNAERARAGQTAYAPDPRLSEVAQRHACEMAGQGYVSHTGQNGARVSDRVKATGFRTCLTAENIGFGLGTVGALMQTLMASPPHRANILNRRLQAAGFGYVPATGGSGPWWVQVYADPC
jgi:uncharacterized protein YkwD